MYSLYASKRRAAASITIAYMGILCLDRLKTSSRPHSNIDEWKARMQDTPPAEMHVIRPLHTILGTYPAINKGYALF